MHPSNTLLWAILLPALFLLLWALFRLHRGVSFTAEPFAESQAPLKNPYCGLYRIFVYTLSDAYTPTDDYAREAENCAETLALLEINLKNYRTGEISETGLLQLEDILAAWSHSPHGTGLILRFLYDTAGLATATEPSSLRQVQRHMEQVSAAVNRHSAAVHILQGVCIGNWGEMHHSAFANDDAVKQLLLHWNRLIDPSVYLAVRTPAAWRMVNDVYTPPSAFPAPTRGGAPAARLGLFNDGILGSESDLGTYGDTPRKAATAPGYKGTRAEELRFQNALCRYVPNGGEVVFNQTLCALKDAVSTLQAMHVSYLNAAYDSRVYARWKEAVWTGDDAFFGCDGYSYVKAHLGYRYFISACKIKKRGVFSPTPTLSLTLQNSGFSAALRPAAATLTLLGEQTEARICIPFPADLREIDGGGKKTFTLPLAAKTLPRGGYRVYFSVTDCRSGQAIRLANTAEPTEYGYALGRLEL